MKTQFVNGNPSQGIMGTVVTAEFLNAVNNHRHTGVDADGAGVLDYAVDAGSVDGYEITLTPPLDAYVTGMPIFFKAANTNTGTATLEVNGLGPKDIKKNAIEDLSAGDIVEGQVVCAIYDGICFQIIGLVSSGGSGNVGDVRISLSPTPNEDEVKLNGAELSRSSYDDLWQWAQDESVVVAEASWSPGNTGAFSSGDGSTTFRVPDVRGEFPRFFDDSRGIDSGRVFGSFQADAFKSHTHGSVIKVPGNTSGAVGSDFQGGNTAAAGGTETRPRNITFYAFIKYK